MLCLVLSGAFWYLSRLQPDYSFTVLMVANLIMCCLAIGSVFHVSKQARERPQAFVRGVGGASLLRLLIGVVGIVGYVMFDRRHVHKPTLFLLFSIYLIYTVAETLILSRLVKRK